MASESSLQDSDAENERLMSYHDSEKLTSSDSGYIHSEQLASFTKTSLTILLLSTAVISVLLSTLTFHLLQIQHTHPQPGEIFGSCGDTPTSARLTNCTFDIMSFSWLPPACSDPELTAEFSTLRNWTWWLEPEQKTAMGMDDVQSGNYKELFVSREYHMFHCTYMWRKLHRGMLRDRVVDTYINSYAHTAHCEMMLLGMEGEKNVDRNATDTAILMKYPRCIGM